jgi:hypothetical protein
VASVSIALQAGSGGPSFVKWDYEDDIQERSDIADMLHAPAARSTLLFFDGRRYSGVSMTTTIIWSRKKGDRDIKLVPERLSIHVVNSNQMREITVYGCKTSSYSGREEASVNSKKHQFQLNHKQADIKVMQVPPSSRARCSTGGPQVYSQTVGADVSITAKPRSNVRFRSLKRGFRHSWFLGRN